MSTLWEKQKKTKHIVNSLEKNKNLIKLNYRNKEIKNQFNDKFFLEQNDL